VGRLIEEEDIGGLQHELSDKYASSFSAGKTSNQTTKIFTTKKKASRPSRDVDDAILINDGIAVQRESTTEEHIKIELAILIEVNDAQIESLNDFANA